MYYKPTNVTFSPPPCGSPRSAAINVIIGQQGECELYDVDINAMNT